MQTIHSPAGATVSYEKYGSGPPLVLVHGGFSDHRTNWEFVAPMFEQQFTVYAIARRGRGQTDATDGHTLDDEAIDVATVIGSIGEPVFLLGHSYGAMTALTAAIRVPERIRKLVLYETPRPDLIGTAGLARLEAFAQAGDWDGFAATFFGEMLLVPQDELNAVRASELWQPILDDAKASLGDLRALTKHEFAAERCRALRMPVLLQIGTESPRGLYLTDRLVAVLPDVRIGALQGQAHEGMTTAPELYAEHVFRFLLGDNRAERHVPSRTLVQA